MENKEVKVTVVDKDEKKQRRKEKAIAIATTVGTIALTAFVTAGCNYAAGKIFNSNNKK